MTIRTRVKHTRGDTLTRVYSCDERGRCVIVFGRAGEVTYANARKEAKQRDAAAVPTTDTTDVTDSRHNTTHGRH